MLHDGPSHYNDQRPLIAYPFPFSNGEFGRLDLPADGLTVGEATHLKEFIDSLVTKEDGECADGC